MRLCPHPPRPQHEVEPLEQLRLLSSGAGTLRSSIRRCPSRASWNARWPKGAASSFMTAVRLELVYERQSSRAEQQKPPTFHRGFLRFSAERGRFELPLPLQADRFSKPARSAAPPPLH